MHHQFNEVASFILGILGVIVGLLFDVPWPTLWTAAFGSFIGLSLKPATSIKNGFAIVFLGACSVGLLVPIVSSDPTGIPQKSIAFLIAAVVIAGRNILPQGTQDILQASINRLIELIRGWGPKA